MEISSRKTKLEKINFALKQAIRWKFLIFIYQNTKNNCNKETFAEEEKFLMKNKYHFSFTIIEFEKYFS